jgi:nicotinate phosphoribosyltransferase
MPGGLLTDLYEVNMAASYLRRGMTAPATFSLYVRELPPTRGFLVAAGLAPCLAFVEAFGFDPDELEHLASIGFDDRAIELLASVRFEGDVRAIPEGRVVHAEEPILEVTAPIAVAQLLETFLLNQITMHTTIASKAARYVAAAEGRDLVDFSFRRAHGVEGGEAAARASAIVGFVATSNVAAARSLGLPAAGTMAHSFIEAFPSEEDAFRAFAEDHPKRTTFLVDTYDTLNGVRHATAVARALGLTGGVGVRLDSGDLDRLAREVRTALDDGGFPNARIFASGGLDERYVADLVRAGAPIDAFGIGTQMAVSADAPYLDTVYKLVAYEGRPVMKLSTGKATSPGRKQVWRADDEDVIGLADEDGTRGEPLLETVLTNGKRLIPDPSIDRMRERFAADLAALASGAKRLKDPQRVRVRRSRALEALTRTTREESLRRSAAS